MSVGTRLRGAGTRTRGSVKKAAAVGASDATAVESIKPGSARVLEVAQLSKSYGDHTVLHPVDFTLDRGEILAVVGPSGSGKSTLLHLINQIRTPTTGSVKLDGQELTTLRGKNQRLARRKIGMAFQSAALFQRRTARRNVAVPLEYLGVTDRQIKEVTDHLLERVGLSDRADYYPGQLSGGQKQRLPPVLLADEITSGLDPTTTESILQLIASLRDELDLAVILVTHEMSVVRTFADSVLLLEDGHVVDRGRTGALLRDVHSRAGAELHRLGTPLSTDDEQVVELLYTSTAVPADWLSRLTRELDTEIDLLDASIERVGGHAHGRVRIRVNDPDKQRELVELVPTLGLVAVGARDE